jgi:Predicted extracellular nuclease
MRRPVSVLALAIALATLPAVAASPRVMPIGQVQGLGERSPLEGRQVTVEAMLTADLRQGLGGVFVQDAGDGDARTSDALFVQAGGELSLQPGQWWRITGTVVEQPAGKDGQALTSLADARFTAMPARAPVPVQALSDVPESWEALEGMQVRIDAPLTLVGQDQLPRFGELVRGLRWPPVAAERGRRAGQRRACRGRGRQPAPPPAPGRWQQRARPEAGGLPAGRQRTAHRDGAAWRAGHRRPAP